MFNPYETFFNVNEKITHKKIMNSLQRECNEVKQAYDACYSVWFTEKFLNGNTEDDACAALYASYQQCLKKAMKDHNIHLKEIGIDNFEIEKSGKTSGH